MMEFRNLHNSEWQPLMCLRLDVADLLNGDMDKGTFIEYAKVDLERLTKILHRMEIEHIEHCEKFPIAKDHWESVKRDLRR